MLICVSSLIQHLHESFLSDVSSLMERMMDRQRQELDTHMGKVGQSFLAPTSA